jgi:hypothetical protein
MKRVDHAFVRRLMVIMATARLDKDADAIGSLLDTMAKEYSVDDYTRKVMRR